MDYLSSPEDFGFLAFCVAAGLILTAWAWRGFGRPSQARARGGKGQGTAAPLLYFSQLGDAHSEEDAYLGVILFGNRGSGKTSCAMPTFLLPMLRGGGHAQE